MKTAQKYIILFVSLILTCITIMPCISLAQSQYISSIWHTKNNAKVFYYHTPNAQMLEINVAFKAGSMFDGKDFGLSALTTRLLHLGNGTKSAEEIALDLEQIGAQYNYNTSRDMTVVSIKTLVTPEVLNKAIETFTLIINKPNFHQQEFEREKNKQLIEIKNSLDSPEEVANQAFFKAVYENHPYAHPVYGDDKHVKAISLDKVVNFYKKYFTENNATIVIVGDVNHKKAKEISELLMQSLAKNHVKEKFPEPLAIETSENFEIKYPKNQTVIRMGQLGIDYHNTDYFKLLIGNYILGAGNLVSRLGTELREKRGLTYGVYSQFLPMLEKGPFIISLATKNSQKKLATDITRQTLLEFLDNGPSEAELIDAKKYLTSSFPLALASNHNIATMLLKIAFYNLPEDYLDTYTKNINSVSANEIKTAMQNILNPNKFINVCVGGA